MNDYAVLEKTKFPMASVLFTLYTFLYCLLTFPYLHYYGGINRFFVILDVMALTALCILLFIRKHNIGLACIFAVHTLINCISFIYLMRQWGYRMPAMVAAPELLTNLSLILMTIFAFCMAVNYKSGFRKVWFVPGTLYVLLALVVSLMRLPDIFRSNPQVFLEYIGNTFLSIFYAVALFLLGEWMAYPVKEVITASPYHCPPVQQTDPVVIERRFCTECGNEILSGAGFCHVCGAKVYSAPAEKASVNQPGMQQPVPPQQDAPNGGMAALGFFIPLVGLILYLVWKDQTPLKAKSAGKGALIGAIVWGVLSIFLLILSALLPALLPAIILNGYY